MATLPGTKQRAFSTQHYSNHDMSSVDDASGHVLRIVFLTLAATLKTLSIFK